MPQPMRLTGATRGAKGLLIILIMWVFVRDRGTLFEAILLGG